MGCDFHVRRRRWVLGGNREGKREDKSGTFFIVVLRFFISIPSLFFLRAESGPRFI
jgi:hypothetical protein